MLKVSSLTWIIWSPYINCYPTLLYPLYSSRFIICKRKVSQPFLGKTNPLKVECQTFHSNKKQDQCIYIGGQVSMFSNGKSGANHMKESNPQKWRCKTTTPATESPQNHVFGGLGNHLFIKLLILGSIIVCNSHCTTYQTAVIKIINLVLKYVDGHDSFNILDIML